MTTCVRCVRRCAKARGPISAIQPTNRLQTRASIEFSILAVFRFAWVQTCEPGTHEGSHLPRCRHPAQARADRAFGPLAHTARCEPQTLQTLFFGRTVARYCARAPRIGFWEGRTPLAGASPFPPTTTIEADRHHHHNHHRRRDGGDSRDDGFLLFTSAWRRYPSPGRLIAFQEQQRDDPCLL